MLKYAERCLNSFSTEAEKDKVEKALIRKITHLVNNIGMNIVDWNKEPMPL